MILIEFLHTPIIDQKGYHRFRFDLRIGELVPTGMFTIVLIYMVLKVCLNMKFNRLYPHTPYWNLGGLLRIAESKSSSSPFNRQCCESLMDQLELEGTIKSMIGRGGILHRCWRYEYDSRN